MDRPIAPELRDAVAPESGSRPLLDTARIALHPIELSIHVVSTLQELRALKSDYDRLERASGNTLPFALHEWHVAWCEHLLNRRPQRVEQLRLLVLRNRSGDCVALVPLVLTKYHFGPIRLSTIDFLGSDEGLTDIRSALIEPGYEQPSVRCVYQWAQGLPGWQWLHWRDANQALATALTLELGPRWRGVRLDCVLDLPSSWAEFRAGLPRNVRESLRHCYNSLRHDGHTFELVVARTPGEVLESLPRFLELHALRARMAWGPSHFNHFASPTLQGFLRQVLSTLAARDAVRVFQLRIADSVAASQVGFVVGDSLYLYYSGFDPDWAHYAVMTTTVAEAFRYAIAHGLRKVNLSPSPLRSKVRWRPRLIELRSCLLHGEALSSRLVCSTYARVESSKLLPVRLLQRLLRARLRWR